jgi:ACT domain-containing protein
VSAIVVSISAGIGSYIAFCINNKFSKETVYINIVTSNDKDKMKDFGDYMREQGIKIVTFDAYNDEINSTLTALVFANTREQSKRIDKYMETKNGFFREVVN